MKPSHLRFLIDGTSSELDSEELNCFQLADYNLVSRLGEGAFGQVYLAEENEGQQRLVAIKVLKENILENSSSRRFEEEQSILAKLDHPGIARIFHTGETSNQLPFIAMELIEGDPISSFFQNHNESLQSVLYCFIQVCLATQHAHIHGIIHRDLKPSNILVYRDSDQEIAIKLIDFGIAKDLEPADKSGEEMTRHGSILGTPSYMSPEQARATQRIDSRSDIFSLGCILHELLTGSPPLPSETFEKQPSYETLKKVAEQEAPRLKENQILPHFRDSHRSELSWILEKSLQPQIDSRYQTLQELIYDIHSYLEHRPISAGPHTSSYFLKKFIRRHRSTCVVALCIFFLISTALIVSLYFYRDASLARDSEILAHTETLIAKTDLTKAFSMADHKLAISHNLNDNEPTAIAHWCRALRTDPSNAQAASMLLSKLSFASGPYPASEALKHKPEHHQIGISRNGTCSYRTHVSPQETTIEVTRWNSGEPPKSFSVSAPSELPLAAISPNGEFLAYFHTTESLRITDTRTKSHRDYPVDLESGLPLCLIFSDSSKLSLVFAKKAITGDLPESGAISWSSLLIPETSSIKLNDNNQHALLFHKNKSVSAISFVPLRVTSVTPDLIKGKPRFILSSSGSHCLFIQGPNLAIFDLKSQQITHRWKTPFGNIDTAFMGAPHSPIYIASGSQVHRWNPWRRHPSPLKQHSLNFSSPIQKLERISGSHLLVTLKNGALISYNHQTHHLRTLREKLSPASVTVAASGFLLTERKKPFAYSTLWKSHVSRNKSTISRTHRDPSPLSISYWNEFLVTGQRYQLKVFNSKSPIEEVKNFSFPSNITGLSENKTSLQVHLKNGETYEIAADLTLSKAMDFIQPHLSHTHQNKVTLYTKTDEISYDLKSIPTKIRAHSQDGKSCVIALKNRQIKLLKSEQNTPLNIPHTHTARITSLHFIDSSHVISTALDGQIQHHRIGYDQPTSLIRFAKESILSSYLSDNKCVLATLSRGNILQFWNTKDLKAITIPIHLDYPIKSLALSYNGDSCAILNHTENIETHRLYPAPPPIPPSFCDYLEKWSGLQINDNGNLLISNPQLPPLPSNPKASTLLSASPLFR